jgi:hypothetical protein
MNMRPCTAFLAALALCLATEASASADELDGQPDSAGLSVRFHPSDQVWAHPLESARSIQSVLLHNAALVNEGTDPVTIDAVEVQVLHAGAVISTLRIDAATLEAMARQGAAMDEAGMLQALDFQFAPARLLGENVQLSASRTLSPGTALMLVHRFVSYQGQADRLRVTAQLGNSTVRPSGELKIRQGTAGSYRFPLEGRWFVGAGATPHSHHRWVIAEEFALDFAQIGADGKTYRGDGSRMEDYYAYGAPVLAVAGGAVVKVLDAEGDNVAMLRGPHESLGDYQQRLRAGQSELLAAGSDAIVGNHVVVKHADGTHGVYAHLQPRSVKVRVGDQIEVGQQLAAVGGSGNSTEPHLHFHLCEAAETLHCSGLPVAFDNIEIPWSDGPRGLQSGDMVVTLKSGKGAPQP